MDGAGQRVRVQYTGRVQGVGFRATAWQTAGGFRVSGFVRNRPDGTVELEAQGDAGEVNAFLDALAARMRGHIARSERSLVRPLDGEAGFRIEY